ncbi:hypothetical protein [Xylocopilactobacillus apis]|uniref:Uncharacterized protein n=1 Tax=Xylocopilactobacillus apis TaxID=2932183 RepID=A0AAU9CWT8_9LACO|nr:hypothetical protein [Xylocopilactobacillus apis]BDR56901.1 hypothetical protein KIMC2_14630 [Xylocopilactobacillus apis]
MKAKFYDPQKVKEFCEEQTKKETCEKIILFMEEDERWGIKTIWMKDLGYLIDLDQDYIYVAGAPGSIWGTPCIRAEFQMKNDMQDCYKEEEVGEKVAKELENYSVLSGLYRTARGIDRKKTKKLLKCFKIENPRFLSPSKWEDFADGLRTIINRESISKKVLLSKDSNLARDQVWKLYEIACTSNQMWYSRPDVDALIQKYSAYADDKDLSRKGKIWTIPYKSLEPFAQELLGLIWHDEEEDDDDD